MSTRSSIKMRESRRRCISFSIAYAQKEIEISTTAIRSTDGVMSERTGVFGHSEIIAAPTAIETSRTAVTIHSCSRRRSTASRDGIWSPLRPTTRASLRIRSDTGGVCVAIALSTRSSAPHERR